MISENERHYAEMVLGVIDTVECPMLMYEGEKAIVRKALKAYIESNGTADTPQTDLVKDSDDLVKDLVKDTPQTECIACKHWELGCELPEGICEPDPIAEVDCGWGKPK